MDEKISIRVFFGSLSMIPLFSAINGIFTFAALGFLGILPPDISEPKALGIILLLGFPMTVTAWLTFIALVRKKGD